MNKLNKGFFILGTDTGVGKTLVAMSLLVGLKKRGFSTVGLKPIASGAELTRGKLRNEDALSLQSAAGVYLQYAQVNPFCFAEATAPHIAANQVNCSLSVSTIIEACLPALNIPVDFRIIEGVGGVCVPLNEKESFTDLVQAIGFPCILVVGLRLGCLNQALLSWKYLQQRNIPVIGWLANQVDPSMKFIKENIKFLKTCLPTLCLGSFLHIKQNNLSDFSSLIDYKALLNEN